MRQTYTFIQRLAGIMVQTTADDVQCHRIHVFIVRLWIKDLGAGKSEWRGQVKHLMSGKVNYFRDLSTLEEHLKTMLPRVVDDESVGTD